MIRAYSTSKSAIIGLARTIAVDYAKEGIRANGVLPASIDTPLLRAAADIFKGDKSVDILVNEWGKMHPVGRVEKQRRSLTGSLFSPATGPRSLPARSTRTTAA